MGIGRQVTTSLDGVRDKNIMQLKKLNSVLFPVRYNDKYYADALASGEFTKLGLLFLHFQILGFLLFSILIICPFPLFYSFMYIIDFLTFLGFGSVFAFCSFQLIGLD